MGNKLTMPSKISGVTYDDPASGISRQEIIRQHLRLHHRLDAIYEPDNPHGDSAIGLWLVIAPVFKKAQRFHVGYIPTKTAERLMPYIRAHRPIEVRVTDITGGTTNKPTLGVNIEISVQT